MTPLMFGAPARRLFGIFHPAPAGTGVRHAVLICPPFGPEGLRTHRLFKVLAERLARGGTAVLRFDYYGSGDSPGHEEEGELEGWREDLCVAHAELHRLAPSTRIVWVGARLGATLALMAARDGRCAPARLVLWEPILDGRRYLLFLRQQHVAAIDGSFCIPDLVWRRALAEDPDAVPRETLGTAISDDLGRQLGALRTDDLSPGPRHDTVMFADPGDACAARWATSQQRLGLPLRFEAWRHALAWTSDPYPDSAMVPAAALRQLQGAIHE